MNRYKQLKKTLNGVGSVVYFIVLDNLILNIPVVPRKDNDN
jgi:hypothetical protein